MNKKDISSYTFKDKLIAFLETTRPYTLLWCGLVSLAGACIGLEDFPNFEIAFLVFFTPIMGWIAGLCVSDYFDRDLDRIQKAHRPIPSGKIRANELLVIGVIFAIGGLVFSYILGIQNLIIALIVATLVISYAKITKSRGLIGNINRGVITGTAFFFGIFSVNSNINSFPIYVFFISLVFIIHDINSNLVGAIRDIEGDKKGGYITFPVKYGVKKSIFLSLVLSLTWIFLAIFIPYYSNFLNTAYFIILIVVLAIVVSLYIFLFKSLSSLNRKQALHAHEFFVIERVTFASAFILGVSLEAISTILFIGAVIITILLQYLLRERYEFVADL